MSELQPMPRAVFLSYAREDSEAVRRIADALRAFGVEVWFDQNELRGGDTWDAKIRTQIRTCALCIPVISAATQSRGEGYFRREWKLAVERTHDMASGVPFLLPVAIDDTSESAALVPDEFMRVQWTRLAHGVPTPQFVEQVKSLLENPGKAAGRSRPAVGGIGDPGRREAGPGSVTPVTTKGMPGWTWGSLTAVIVGVAVALSVSRKHARVAEPPAVPAAEPAPAAAPVVNDKSIAVLPFENMSEQKDANAFFADGIHEDILTNLALVHELRVVSRTSVMQYRGTTKTTREIGKELGVAYVLEGSVQRAGNQVRVTGQLIDARTDQHVWAKAYDRDITDIFAIQSELSQDIATALAAVLSPREKSLIDRRPTDNLEAYDAYLKAHQLVQTGLSGPNDLVTVESLLKKAVELDPQFALAWGELGRFHAFVYFSETDRSADRLAHARTAIETAVRLAPNSPEVIEDYGDYFYYGFRDYASAAGQYQRLAVLRPNDVEVFGSLGLIHRRQGRLSEALAELRHAVQLEPRNLRYLRTLQQLVQALDRYDEAAELQKRVVELSPGDPNEEANLHVISFLARGSTKEFDDWQAQAKPADRDSPVGLYGRKQWAINTGNLDEAIRLDGRQRYFDAFGLPHWVQDVTMAFVRSAHGDAAEARTLAEGAIPAGREDVEQKPSATAWSSLGGAYVLVGNKEEALRCARQAMELVPEATDAVAGPAVSLSYGATLAWLGDKDGALAVLARLLRTPYGENVYSAKDGLLWFPLRGDPRFEALVNDPKNNSPISPADGGQK